MRRLLLVAGAVAGLLTVFTGSYLVVNLLALERHERTDSFASVSTVHLAFRGGDTVRVVGDAEPGEGIVVEQRWREGLRSASPSVRVDADRLVVDGSCPQEFELFCSLQVTVHVPPGTEVTGSSTSKVEVIDVAGSVTLRVHDASARVEGASGTVQVRGDNGSIDVVGGSGDLDLRTSNGAVRALRVRPDRLTLRSWNGSIRFEPLTVPTAAVLQTSNGSVRVVLPADSPPIATTLVADGGSVDDLIRKDPEAPNRIEARTENGSISLRYRD